MNIKLIKKTPFGPVAIIWTGFNPNTQIIRVLLSMPGLSAEEQAFALYPNSVFSSCTEIDTVALSISGILEGNNINIPLDVADLSACSEFQQSVLRAEYPISRGSVSTYRLIAKQVGKPKGARAVGSALAHNPFPLIVPCHRAIRSDRHLGGYKGGIEMKRALLEMEGIPFDSLQRVVCEHFHYAEINSG
jgi:methylated-DNA-[protein]-cysteine S-methyltransferase